VLIFRLTASFFLAKEQSVGFKIPELAKQIQRNCDISDANHAGLYSLCGLLLRLRDLYKWEQGLNPWQEPEPADLLEWVDNREQYWESIDSSEPQPIVLGNESFEAFDMAAINLRLRPSGLIYGAGYVLGMKPSFFLGEVTELRTLGTLQVAIVGRELARDIYMTPAMRQGDQIFARHPAMLFFLWDQILEMRPSVRDALDYALQQYGLDAEALRRHPGELGPKLHPVARQEIETWIYHEVGEVHGDAFDGQVWHEIVATYCNSPIEIFARVTKDLLADTHPRGLLGHIIGNQIHSSLGFYISFMRPFARAVFPEMAQAFRDFMVDGDWRIIESARSQGQAKATAYARQLVTIHEAGRRHQPEWAKAQIISKLIEPLGIAGALREGPGEEE
jgi:hypothetical protein